MINITIIMYPLNINMTCTTTFVRLFALGAAFVAIVIYIVYIANLTARVKRLEAKTAPQLTIIEREIHGIGFYIRIIVYMAILFCLIAAVHYLTIFYPRFSTIAEHQSYVANLGIDYWGIIVGFMALLVTLLVGWQIYATIKAKEELAAVQKEIKEGYDKRISKMENCCDERKEDLKSLKSDLDNMRNRLTEVDSEARNFACAVMHHSTGSEYLRDNIPTGAYSDFLEALRLLIKSGASKRPLDSLLLYQYVDSLSRTITKVRNENTEWAIRIFNSEKEFDKQEYDIQALLSIHECDDSIKENFAHIISERKKLIQQYGMCTEEDLRQAFQNRMNIISPDEDNEDDTSDSESSNPPQSADKADDSTDSK